MGYVAFDIETSKLIPAGGWQAGRPMGITCIALAWLDSKGEVRTISFHGEPCQPMTGPEVADVVRKLQASERKGHTIIGWNSLAFDFPILADESGLYDECAMLALRHVDMMFNIFCRLGYPVGLDRVAKGLGLAGKSDGISGKDAPRLWAQGEIDLVLDYAEQDVRTTLEIALLADQRHGLQWSTAAGKPAHVVLESWLPCYKAQRLPLPEIGNLKKQISRDEFTEWMEAVAP